MPGLPHDQKALGAPPPGADSHTPSRITIRVDPTAAIRDPERLTTIRRIAFTNAAAGAFDRLARVAARALHAPVALVSIVEADRQSFVGCAGLPEPWASTRETPLSHSFCQYVVATGEPLVIADAREHSLVHDNPAIRDLDAVAYVGIPLITPDGYTLGSFCMIDSRPRAWTREEVELLQDLAASVLSEIELLAAARETKRQMDATGRERQEKIALLESTGDGIYGLDQHGHCTFINRAAAELLGYQPAEVLGKNMHTLIHYQHADGSPYPEEECPIFRAFRLGQGVRVADEMLWRKDGTAFPAAYSSYPIAERGTTRGAVVAFTDSTERKQLEAALRRTAQETATHASKLEAIFEAMADGVFVFDSEGSLLQTNAAFREMLGIDAVSDHPLRSLQARAAFLTPRDEQDRPLPQEQWPVPRILRGETLHGERAMDLMLRHRDGRNRLFSISGAPIRDAEGRITGGVLICRDVTERRRLQRATREALHALLAMAEVLVQAPGRAAEPAIVPLSPMEKTPTTMHRVGRRLVELTRSLLGCQHVGIVSLEPATAVQRPIAVVGLSPEHERQWWADTQETPLSAHLDPSLITRLRAGEPLLLDMMQPPFRERRYDALYEMRKVLLVPMQIGSQLNGLLAVEHHDPTHRYTPDEIALVEAVARLATLVFERERLLHEREEARANELALREANRRMDEFLGIVSHELRTPLTTIKANIQVAERQLNGMMRTGAVSAADLAGRLERLQGLLTRAERQVERQNRLVGDLLDVSRIQSGKLELRLAPCNLATVIRDVIEEQRLTHLGRTITFTLPDPPAVPVLADADRVAQVITNYLTNALKYSPEDRPVAVTLQVQGTFACLAVRDEGPGLPPEEQEQIWERFHRAPDIEVQSGSGVGLGLGLHISRSLIERHHGQVGVQSAPGQGSTFWFTLPLAGS
jgi:PAS domain S-box-containing protein